MQINDWYITTSLQSHLLTSIQSWTSTKNSRTKLVPCTQKQSNNFLIYSLKNILKDRINIFISYYIQSSIFTSSNHKTIWLKDFSQEFDLSFIRQNLFRDKKSKIGFCPLQHCSLQPNSTVFYILPLSIKPRKINNESMYSP